MDGVPDQTETTFDEASGRPGGESQPGEYCYQIRVDGHLNSRWSRWFEGLVISHQEDGTTLLTGPIIDQPALHGLIIKIRDLGMPLLSVVQTGKDGAPWSG